MDEGATYDLFLSFDRRDHGGYGDRLLDALTARAGHVFSSADPTFRGEGWLERLDATLGRCSCLVVLIGTEWLDTLLAAEQKADDHLRLELERGIRRGLPLVSVMVGGATMPADSELPQRLQVLRAGDGVRMSEVSWQDDLNQLFVAIDRTRTASPLQIGTVFAGHRVELLLGRGSMGVVYRARHLSWERWDAIKVVSPELARQWGVRERFTRESRLAASLRHPNVVAVYDAGEESGLLYLTMQLVEGPDQPPGFGPGFVMV